MVQVGNETTSSGIAGEAGEERYQLFAAGAKSSARSGCNYIDSFSFYQPR